MLQRADMAQFTSSGLALKWSALRAARRESMASISAFFLMKAARAASRLRSALSVRVMGGRPFDFSVSVPSESLYREV